MSNHRADAPKDSQKPGNGGTQGHRDGMKDPANLVVDKTRGSRNGKESTTAKVRDKSGPARGK